MLTSSRMPLGIATFLVALFPTFYSANVFADQCGLLKNCNPNPPPPPTGSCQPANSLTILAQGPNVVAYTPKGNWERSTTGISVTNVEGTSAAPKLVSTPNPVNSCAANPKTGQTVCVSNGTDVYLLKGTALIKTLTSAGAGTIPFSGGRCTNCNVAIDAIHNKATIGLAVSGFPGFQILDLATATFEKPFMSPAGNISEDPLVDPTRNLLLSASEANDYEIVNIATSTKPVFYELAIPFSGGDFEADSSGEDCATGIAITGAEFSSPSQVFLADLSQAKFNSGSGRWTAPSQVQILSESVLSSGANGIAVAQGTHIGLVTGEFGGSAITAIALPTKSGPGTGVPKISDWVTCNIPGGFQLGFDPHTVTAYQSVNGAKDAFAVLANSDASQLAVVDLTKMLSKTALPRTGTGHACAAGSLPTTIASFVSTP